MLAREGKERDVALEQFLSLTAKYPHCLAYPERLREVFESEKFAVAEPWRRDLLLSLCRQGFAPRLRLRKNSASKLCSQACDSLVASHGCLSEQASWAVEAWRVVALGAQKQSPWAKCLVGDVFVFGNYPQGSNGEVQPIEWQVLRRDDDGLLVISKYALDCKQYNERNCSITWSQCTLRKWLNSEFIAKAFDATERQQIMQVHLRNPNSKFDSSVPGGPDTEDKIFLLSHDEAEQLFAGSDCRKCRATAYAQKNNAYTVDNGMCCWWLRSPGGNTIRAAFVLSDGGLGTFGVTNDRSAVLPAFKIAL